jgi:hypothetical protein
MVMSTIEDLRKEWAALYSKTLPQMAGQRDPAQSRWPVTRDHCFARIILDNVIGKGKQRWDETLPRPAIRNMSKTQLQESIAMAVAIMAGDVNLVQLDEASLRCRGKNLKKHARSTMKTTLKQQKQSPPGAGSKRHAGGNTPENSI